MSTEIARKQLYGMIDDIEEYMTMDLHIGKLDILNIIICGMGGSAISANILADCCFNYVDIPISINRSPLLPKWVGKNTLAIVSSYSGNTDETVEMYHRAKEARLPIIAISSGGKIAEMAEADGNVMLTLPIGWQPRFSIGFMMGYIINILKSIGHPQLYNKILPCFRSLREYRDYLDSDNSIAIEIAKKYMDCVPVICTENKFKSISLRWKAQFNENSKIVAFNTAISEFNFCETSPWANYKGDKLRLIVLVTEDDISEGGFVATAVKNIESLKIPYDLMVISGLTHEERLFRAVLLGDYISLYIAKYRGIDPENVDIITCLKQMIRSK